MKRITITNHPGNSKRGVFLVAAILILFMVVLLGNTQCSNKKTGPDGTSGPVLTNQNFIDALDTNLDITDVKMVFQYIISHLPEENYVYPTENYYYFNFYAKGKCYWGNLRLGIEERDHGMLNFAYYEYVDDPKSRDDFKTSSKKFGPADGVIVKKISNLRYSVSYKGKTLIFVLNDIKQEPPKLFKLKEDEEFVARTFDESGFQFFLIFKNTHSHFLWILNEENGFPAVLIPLQNNIVYDKLSGFAFYVSETGERKTLIGVWAQNVRRNNYWDGPFDQLADNFVNLKLADYIQQAYPYTKNRVDKFGKFLDVPGMRMAITAYYEYESIDELIEIIEDCKKQPKDEFYPCITYDYKTSW